MIKLIDILNEGAYDSMTRNIVKTIIEDWKSQYTGDQGELELDDNFELTDAQKKLLSMPISKAVILAALFYISTRSIKWTIVLLALYFIVINMLLNENHPLNIFSPEWLLTQGFLQNNEVNKSYTDLYMKNIANFH